MSVEELGRTEPPASPPPAPLPPVAAPAAPATPKPTPKKPVKIAALHIGAAILLAIGCLFLFLYGWLGPVWGTIAFFGVIVVLLCIPAVFREIRQLLGFGRRSRNSRRHRGGAFNPANWFGGSGGPSSSSRRRPGGAFNPANWFGGGKGSGGPGGGSRRKPGGMFNPANWFGGGKGSGGPGGGKGGGKGSGLGLGSGGSGLGGKNSGSGGGKSSGSGGGKSSGSGGGGGKKSRWSSPKDFFSDVRDAFNGKSKKSKKKDDKTADAAAVGDLKVEDEKPKADEAKAASSSSAPADDKPPAPPPAPPAPAPAPAQGSVPMNEAADGDPAFIRWADGVRKVPAVYDDLASRVLSIGTAALQDHPLGSATTAALAQVITLTRQSHADAQEWYSTLRASNAGDFQANETPRDGDHSKEARTDVGPIFRGQ